MARGGGSLARSMTAAATARANSHAPVYQSSSSSWSWSSSSSSTRLAFWQRFLGGAGNVVAFVALVTLAARAEALPIDSVPAVAMVLLGVLSLVAGLLACF